MADETSNRVSLEYAASVDRASMDAAKAETIRNAEETARAAQAAAKPQNVTNAEEASANARAAEQAAQAARKVAEETRRAREEEDRLYQSISSTNDKAAQLTTQFHNLSSSRAGSLIAADVQKAELQLAQARARAQELRAELEKPEGERGIENISNAVRVAESRVQRLTQQLQQLNRESARAARSGGGAGAGGDGGDDLTGAVNQGFSRFGRRRAITAAADALGLPSQVGNIASLAAFGVPAPVVGGIAAVAGVRELIKAGAELETSQINLQASARSTGQTFADENSNARLLADTLNVTKEKAGQVANAFGELKTSLGGSLTPGDTEKLGSLAFAQGLDPEKTAAAIKSLAQGSKEGFEQLTGQRADIVLDRYAKSVGTTTARLSDMQKAQILTNEAVKSSAEFADIAARRTDSLANRWQSFKNTLSEGASDFGSALIARFIYGENSDVTYQRTLQELGNGGSNKAELDAARKRVEQQKEADAQQRAQLAETERIADLQTQARTVSEDYGSGLRAPERQAADLARVRANREALQAEFEHFQTIKSQFSSTDADKFEKQFTSEIQSATDQIRGMIEATANEARGHVESLARDVQNSAEEFANLKLPTESNNPYVKLFADGEKQLESFRSRFALLGQDQIDFFARQAEAAQNAKRYDLEVKDAMSATKLEFEAAELARPFEQLTGAMKRTISVFNEELKAATNNPELRAKAVLVDATGNFDPTFFRNPAFADQTLRGNAQTGRPEINQEFVQGQEFKRLTDLLDKYKNTKGLGGDEVREKVNEALSKLYDELTPRARQEALNNPAFRSTFSNAFRYQADFQDRQIDRQARQAEVSASSVRLAESELAQLNKLSGQPDANRDRTRAEFLSITGAIPREELTPELQAGRIQALKEEANFTRGREERAEKAFKETRNFQKSLIGEDGQGGLLNDMLSAIKGRNDKVLVEVNNRSDRATVSTLGGGFQ